MPRLSDSHQSEGKKTGEMRLRHSKTAAVERVLSRKRPLRKYLRRFGARFQRRSGEGRGGSGNSGDNHERGKSLARTANHGRASRPFVWGRNRRKLRPDRGTRKAWRWSVKHHQCTEVLVGKESRGGGEKSKKARRTCTRGESDQTYCTYGRRRTRPHTERQSWTRTPSLNTMWKGRIPLSGKAYPRDNNTNGKI